jgi:uncharacterized sulfatase
MHKENTRPDNRPAGPWYIAPLTTFTAIAFAYLIMLWTVAIGEIIYNKAVRGLDINWMVAIAIACVNTTIGWLILCPWLLALFLLVYLFSVRLALTILQSIFIVQLIAHLLLVDYFSTAMVPLGADLYGYSWKDIQQTVGTAGGISWLLLLLLTAIITLQWILFRICLKKIKAPTITSLVISAAGIVLLLAGNPEVHTGRSEFTRNLLSDKFSFFAERSWEHFFHSSEGPDIYADSYLSEEQSSTARHTPRHYLDAAAYPFLYQDSSIDVLTPFLHNSETPPNIVLIIVEGLGRAFTNEHAYLGSFTPFLDSLSRKSLYWDNFLSEGGRTFAVLPSILGSLPLVKNGFLELGNEMPPHFSLVNLLKSNGYHTSFYYGGDANFDNMGPFLRMTGIDELNDGTSFPPGYIHIPAKNGFTWGYNDQELFRRWLDSRPQDSKSPQLSVLLTVSMHSPFLLNDPERYDHLFEARMKELGFTQDEIEDHHHYKDQYASILYTDEALRNFFAAFERRKDFDRTIFLITGDHRMPEIPMRDKIDRFHVPLIIYSTMLTRNARFSSVSTHFDITPSLLAYLQHNYGWQLPAAVTWMGDGLDTARSFRNIHSYPLMQTKTDLVDYIDGDIHLNATSIFRLRDGLEEENLSDEDIQQKMTTLMDAYRQRNDKWMQKKNLLPDSLSRHIP